jgi:hypothetical protein
LRNGQVCYDLQNSFFLFTRGAWFGFQ